MKNLIKLYVLLFLVGLFLITIQKAEAKTSVNLVSADGNNITVSITLDSINDIDGCSASTCQFWQMDFEKEEVNNTTTYHRYYSSDVFPANQLSATYKFNLPSGDYSGFNLAGYATNNTGNCGFEDYSYVCPDNKHIIADQQPGFKVINENSFITYLYNVKDSPNSNFGVNVENTSSLSTLHVINLVINENSGYKVPSDYIIHVKNTNKDVSGSPVEGLAGPGNSFTLTPGSYEISEEATTSSSFQQSFTGDCDERGNVTLLSGENKICTIVNTNISLNLPQISQVNENSNLNVPLISIEMVPSPQVIPEASGSATYNYSLRNVGGKLALIDVNVNDDKCTPVTLISGDTNSDSKLDPDENWIYTCTTNLSETTTSTAVATGFSDDSNHLSTINTALATVVVGTPSPELPNTGFFSPIINIFSVPNRLVPFPFFGGDIEYSYIVTNPGAISLHNVFVNDNNCSEVIGPTGDINSNNLLDTTETWKFTCKTHISQSTRNITTVRGNANGFTALGYTFTTVLVNNSKIPGKNIIIIFTIFLIIIILIVYSRTKKIKLKNKK